MPLAPGDETGDADLDRFFAALRQVVHDARERLPVEADQPDDPDPTAAVRARSPGAAPARRHGAECRRRRQWFRRNSTRVTTTELAPTTAELVDSLEADRDLWRERAIVWRERAMGADMLVKTLNAHMSDLQINLEDLRMAMRVMSANTPRPARTTGCVARSDAASERPRSLPRSGRVGGPGPREATAARPLVDPFGRRVLDATDLVGGHAVRRHPLEVRADLDPLVTEVDLGFGAEGRRPRGDRVAAK